MDSDRWLRLLGENPTWHPPTPLPRAIETERTVVRRYEVGDGPGLFAAVDGAREALMPWMLWAVTDHHGVDDSIHYVERQRRGYFSDPTNFAYGIFDRESGVQLGGSGLHDVRARTRQAEVGWWIAGEVQGRGLCVEAVDALIRQALMPPVEGGFGLRRIVAYVPTQNHRSRRVAEKLGMQHEGTLRAERFVGYPEEKPVGYVDVHVFATLAGDERVLRPSTRP
ncbi:MAG: GNAT family N-acetyltransferase [Sandaracinus sp.]|nr:GNAT family N-acetyltransferase [Sandaracinus sp.]